MADHNGPPSPGVNEQAEAMLAPLRLVAPQHATADTVATLQHIVSLLSPWTGSPRWIEAQTMLASHLLECPQGDRSSNVSQAESLYRALLAVVDRESAFDAWLNASAGVAHALISHPSATLATLNEAMLIFESLIAELRQMNRPRDLADVLGNYANLLGRRQHGDIDAATERAIELMAEVVGLRNQVTGAEGRDRRARAQHNLAALYLRRRGGVRAYNVDLAIDALHAALADRPTDLDAVGRIRTLRALAIAYPEWSGADSPAHAQQLADTATAEADAIEGSHAVAGLRRDGWVTIARQQSALQVDLDFLQTMPAPERRSWLRAQINQHATIFQQIGEGGPAALRAEWLGGCARLMGRLPDAGQMDFVPETHHLFGRAFDAVQEASQPRTELVILRRWGEFAHEIGHFEQSFAVYSRAADLGSIIFDDFGAPEHQQNELHAMRGDAQFAAYAAARTGRLDEALRFAELARNRMLADALMAARIAAVAGADDRATVQSALQQVQHLEAELRRVRLESPQQQLEAQRSRLGDALGIGALPLNMRRTDQGKNKPDPTMAAQRQLREQLDEARTGLRELIIRLGARPHDRTAALSADEIVHVARATDLAIVYVLATAHGVAALAGLPDGQVDVLVLDDIDSRSTRELANRMVAVDAGLLAGDAASAANLDATPEIAHRALQDSLFEPVTRWIGSLGVAHARLVTLGTTGLLPWQLHSAEEPVLATAPSASALSLAAVGNSRAPFTGVLIIADPQRDEMPPLPFARAEGRWIAHLFRERGLPVYEYAGTEATLERIMKIDAPVSHLHLACHGHHRSNDPLASALLLADHDALQLSDLLGARATLGQARVATLSACRSAEVESRRLPDEVLGFPVALMLAGVSSVIGTRWAVSDAAAMFFTAVLYPLLLDGVRADTAVVRSRRWLQSATPKELASLCARVRATLTDDDHDADASLSDLWRTLLTTDAADRPFAAPRHWAAFTLDGA